MGIFMKEHAKWQENDLKWLWNNKLKKSTSSGVKKGKNITEATLTLGYVELAQLKHRRQ